MLRSTFLLFVVGISVASAALRLCHTNDFHAKYNEVGEQNVNCKWYNAVANKCFSGIARLTTALNTLSCDVKIQAGDWVQGSLLDTVFHEAIAIAAYSWAKYDFAVMGNHEFDTGTSLINTTIRATSPQMTWLSSNVQFTDPTMTDLPLHRWVDRHNICWVSVLTTSTAVTSSPGDTVEFLDEKRAIKKAIRRCEQQDNVIAITHQGFEEDVQLCKQVDDIDLIIGGHTHTNLDNGKYPHKVVRGDGSVCWVTQTYAHGRYVGVLDVEFDDNGQIYLKTSAYVATDFRIKRDPEVLLKLQLFNNQVNERVERVIGKATEVVHGGTAPCRGGVDCAAGDDNCECHMGNLVCDAVLEFMNKEDGNTKPMVCYQNGGTFRNSFAKGDIKIRDVVNVLPFGNELVSFELTGAQIVDTIRYGVGAILPNREGGAFSGGFGNMEVKARVDEKASGDDQVVIEEVLVNGVPIDLEKEYILLTNSYIGGGGDGYEWPVEGENQGSLLRELTQDYLEKHNPYTPGLGRLHVQNGGESAGTRTTSGSGTEYETEDLAAVDVPTEGAGQCDDDSCAGPETEA